MRLVCPNCGAQYDVPLEVIPEAGRDVQCSNCGNTWFQRRVQQAPDAQPPIPATQESWQKTPEEVAPPASPPPQPAPFPEPEPKRSIDPEMAELFREEREYEERQRTSPTLETQPDLGLEAPAESDKARRARESRERMTRMRGDTLSVPGPDPAARSMRPAQNDAMLQAVAAASAASRRDLLPDVEEINQTLRATSAPRGGTPAAEKWGPTDGTPRETGSPFARGFILMVLLAVFGVSGYVFSPRLSENYPQTAPYLDRYVTTVDAGRLWLDQQVTTLLQNLDQMSSEAGAPPTSPPATD